MHGRRRRPRIAIHTYSAVHKSAGPDLTRRRRGKIPCLFSLPLFLFLLFVEEKGWKKVNEREQNGV